MTCSAFPPDSADGHDNITNLVPTFPLPSDPYCIVSMHAEIPFTYQASMHANSGYVGQSSQNRLDNVCG